jgi:hypothetical protein
MGLDNLQPNILPSQQNPLETPVNTEWTNQAVQTAQISEKIQALRYESQDMVKEMGIDKYYAQLQLDNPYLRYQDPMAIKSELGIDFLPKVSQSEVITGLGVTPTDVNKVVPITPSLKEVIPEYDDALLKYLKNKDWYEMRTKYPLRWEAINEEPAGMVGGISLEGYTKEGRQLKGVQEFNKAYYAPFAKLMKMYPTIAQYHQLMPSQETTEIMGLYEEMLSQYREDVGRRARIEYKEAKEQIREKEQEAGTLKGLLTYTYKGGEFLLSQILEGVNFVSNPLAWATSKVIPELGMAQNLGNIGNNIIDFYNWNKIPENSILGSVPKFEEPKLPTIDTVNNVDKLLKTIYGN